MDRKAIAAALVESERQKKTTLEALAKGLQTVAAARKKIDAHDQKREALETAHDAAVDAAKDLHAAAIRTGWSGRDLTTYGFAVPAHESTKRARKPQQTQSPTPAAPEPTEHHETESDRSGY